MRKRKKVFKAWAVEHPFDWGPALVGRYWNFTRQPIPNHMEGCEVSLFKTRTLARASLHDPLGNKRWPGARAVRVKVTVEIVGK